MRFGKFEHENENLNQLHENTVRIKQKKDVSSKAVDVTPTEDWPWQHALSLSTSFV